MSPSFAAYNISNGVVIQPEIRGDFRPGLSSVKPLPNFSHRTVVQFALAVINAGLIGRFCQPGRDGVFGITAGIAPLKVIFVVIGWIAIQMVDLWQTVWIWQKCQRNKPVGKQWFLSRSIREIDTHVAALHWILSKPDPATGNAGIATETAGLWKAVNTPVLGDLITAFKSGDVLDFHESIIRHNLLTSLGV